MRRGTRWKTCNSHDGQRVQQLHHPPSGKESYFQDQKEQCQAPDIAACQVVLAGLFGVRDLFWKGEVVVLNRTDALRDYLKLC